MTARERRFVTDVKDTTSARADGPNVTKRQSGGLCCITFPPMPERQSPADFHARGEMGLEARAGQSGKTDEGGDTRNLDGPQAKAVVAEMLLDPVDHGVALGPAERAAEEFHDPCVGIHRGK
jgi:hypothetical protein